MTDQTMNAAVLDRPLSLEVKRVPMPVPKPDEALVKVHCIGICGSDVHYYEHGKIGRYEVRSPLILGHELAGDVVAVGDAVRNVSVGDRVAVEPGIVCGRCGHCKEGRYNLCPDVSFMATPPVDGAWAEYVAVRSDFLFALPDELSYEEGALLEPLSVGFHAMRRGRVGPGDRVLVQGLGPVGLLAVVAAKIFGATEVYASDVEPFRCSIAEELGATGVVNPAKEHVPEKIARWTEGEGVDVIIETSGNANAITRTVEIVKRGGRVVYVGLPVEEQLPLNISRLVDAELDLLGVFRYANTYPAAMAALLCSDTNIKKIITDTYSLQEIKEAVEVARRHKDRSIKVMIYPGGDGR